MAEMQHEIGQKTGEEIASLVEYYHKLQGEISRLEASKEIAKDTLLRVFSESKLRYFKAGNLLARVDTRIFERISVKEARELLPPDMFEKLRRESTSVVLSVREVKE